MKEERYVKSLGEVVGLCPKSKNFGFQAAWRDALLNLTLLGLRAGSTFARLVS